MNWLDFGRDPPNVKRAMNLVSICYFYLVNAKSQEPLGGFSSNDMAINYLYLEWDCIAGGEPPPPPPPPGQFCFFTRKLKYNLMEFHQTWLEEAINWLDFEWDGGGGGGGGGCEPPSHPILFIYAITQV